MRCLMKTARKIKRGWATQGEWALHALALFFHAARWLAPILRTKNAPLQRRPWCEAGKRVQGGGAGMYACERARCEC